MDNTGNDDKLAQRPNAAPQDGLHVAGIDGDFSEAVESDHPRCPSCKALHANADPDEDDYLCPRCERTFDRAEADALEEDDD